MTGRQAAQIDPEAAPQLQEVINRDLGARAAVDHRAAENTDRRVSILSPQRTKTHQRAPGPIPICPFFRSVHAITVKDRNLRTATATRWRDAKRFRYVRQRGHICRIWIF